MLLLPVLSCRVSRIWNPHHREIHSVSAYQIIPKGKLFLLVIPKENCFLLIIPKETFPVGYTERETFSVGYTERKMFPLGYTEKELFPIGYTYWIHCVFPYLMHFNICLSVRLLHFCVGCYSLENSCIAVSYSIKKPKMFQLCGTLKGKL